MKTNNFKFDLMVPNLANKDVIYNENIAKIDSLMNIGIKDFVEQLPSEIKPGEKYILTAGEHKNKIAYKTHDSKPIKFIPPIEAMVFFVQSKQSFFIFQEEEWQLINHQK